MNASGIGVPHSGQMPDSLALKSYSHFMQRPILARSARGARRRNEIECGEAWHNRSNALREDSPRDAHSPARSDRRIFALLWLRFRTGTKPSRLQYPCQQAALGLAAATVGAPTVAAVVGIRT